MKRSSIFIALLIVMGIQYISAFADVITEQQNLANAIMNLRERVDRLEKIAYINHGSQTGRPEDEIPSVELPVVGSSTYFDSAFNAAMQSNENPFADNDPFASQAGTSVYNRSEQMRPQQIVGLHPRGYRRAGKDAKRGEKWSTLHARTEARRAAANK